MKYFWGKRSEAWENTTHNNEYAVSSDNVTMPFFTEGTSFLGEDEIKE